MLTRLKGWKTRLFNWGLVIAPALVVYVLDELGRIDWTDHVAPSTALLIPVAIGAANLVLREMTTGPAGGRARAPAGQAKDGQAQDGQAT